MRQVHEWRVTNPDYRLIYSKDGYLLYERADSRNPGDRSSGASPTESPR
jgi:hypothetical protein